MRVIPLAADSLGVRSMATYVEAGELRLLVDPGATLSPRRYGLPPAPAEEEALARAVDRIDAYAVRATAVAVTHYHADHYRSESRLYAGRRVWAKDPGRQVDAHQGVQGRAFWAAVGPHCRLEAADGRVVDLGSAVVRLSPPFPHGLEGTEFGSVVMVTVDDGTRFVHASDVQGPASRVAAAYIVRERPDVLCLSGPATYLQAQTGPEAVRRGVENLVRIVGETGCRVIMDHHAVRDRRFRERLAPVLETGRVVTAAEYLGVAESCLEARRPELWARQAGAGGTGRRAASARTGEGARWQRRR